MIKIHEHLVYSLLWMSVGPVVIEKNRSDCDCDQILVIAIVITINFL